MPAYGGIYEIVNRANGKRYIGSAVSFVKRWSNHRKALERNAHRNAHLQAAWNKYGAEAFEFHPAMLCPRENLIEWEQRYLDEFKPEYNICTVAGSTAGVRPSLATRAKVSAALTGHKRTAEECRKISERSKGNTYALGFKHPPEVGAASSARQKGRVISQAQRDQMSAARRGKPGRKWTDAERAKVSASKKGVPGRVWAPEQRRKVSESLRGRPVSDDTRKKLSDGNKRAWAAGRVGHPMAPSTRLKISAGVFAAHARRRADLGVLQ